MPYHRKQLMNVQQILQQQSDWTWNIMKASADVGEMIREDAITSVNLATINELARSNQIGLQIVSFQGARLESEYGADWFWGLNNKKYLVQAKRLDVVRELSLMSYTVNIEQLKKLVTAAQMLSQEQGIDALPAYVFYNSFLPNPAPGDQGGMWMNAIVLLTEVEAKGKQNQESVTLSYKALSDSKLIKPWYQMF
jgi:ATP adenylyltransferase/5',5'''-P-1,P-4-tetraphosphate phosphorylase II